MRVSKLGLIKLEVNHRERAWMSRSATTPSTSTAEASAGTAELARWKRNVWKLYMAEVYADMAAEYIAIGCSMSILFFYRSHPKYHLSESSGHADCDQPAHDTRGTDRGRDRRGFPYVHARSQPRGAVSRAAQARCVHVILRAPVDAQHLALLGSLSGHHIATSWVSLGKYAERKRKFEKPSLRMMQDAVDAVNCVLPIEHLLHTQQASSALGSEYNFLFDIQERSFFHCISISEV